MELTNLFNDSNSINIEDILPPELRNNSNDNEINIFDNLSNHFSSDAEATLFRSVDDVVPILYITSANIGFRPNAIFTILKDQGYNVSEIRINENISSLKIDKPQGFIMDIGDEIINTSAQKMYLYLIEKSVEYDVPIYAIGQSELLDILDSLSQFSGEIIKFKRPLDMRECLKIIKNDLTQVKVCRKKILAVDDSSTTLKLLKLILGKEYRFFMAGNSTECVKFLAKETPDLIILDYDMPICNGYNLAKMIREEHPQMPIIIYTAISDVTNMIELMQLGIEGYLLKTQPPKEILDYINNYFKKENNK